MTQKKALEIKGLSKVYHDKDQDVVILDDINLDIMDGEIIGILGRSGSGKSTLLRILSGSIKPTSGTMLFDGEEADSELLKTSIMFQSFSLIPWLNVFDNIALGLSRMSLPKNILKSKVEYAIDLVGLGGYEASYPKELSAGMRERVSFARALVIDPEVLLLDSPFTELDYVTANALKADLMDLWFERDTISLKAIMMVTHNIEYAISLCDRILIMSSNPGQIINDIKVNIPRPRNVHSKIFQEMIGKIYVAMIDVDHEEGRSSYSLFKNYPQNVSVKSLIHFMASVRGAEKKNNRASIAKVCIDLNLSQDLLVMFIESLVLLKFIKIAGEDIILTVSGQIFVEADEEAQKVIFKEHMVNNIKFIATLYRKLRDSASGSLPKSIVIKMLEKYFPQPIVLKIISASTDWGLYAGLFFYDHEKSRFKLARDLKRSRGDA